MAKHNAIAAVGQAVIGLLEQNYPATLPPAADFKLYAPTNFAAPMAYGFSLTLYRITVNTTNRNRPPRRNAAGTLVRPSLPVDLHYFLTAWATNVTRQHQMLGWAMRFLDDRSVLPPGVLNSFDANADTFGPGEAVELVCDPLGLQDYLQIWDRLKNKMQVSLNYVARMVLLDSDLEMGDGVAVRSREFKAGQLVSS
ncbi:MAG: DUF4255 domain-containing protein [Betaproteobacteria bacterium]|jgi:hypothetical protein|nr:DUF4255 domain-containing protein [Rhodocyclaceae bacterium]MCA3136062.1 DUF4255 domain-containing protein [Rhodocyclaceae bacterium]MCA3141036.1 DUF4255 domain-containing protein [Rhodocyclaceae bacterium]MCA3146168.1 DUF4255 domain-containing protein [Rhodocyclaceae bacterium]MCE2898287.1 DUF4255 domain-containing protein [Betaproteobacteria bacterium]